MTQTFKLKKGEITFEKDRILITDNAHNQKYMFLIVNVIWILFGFNKLAKFQNTNENLFYMFWVILIALNVVVFIAMLFRSTNKTILNSDIKSIAVKRRLSNSILLIKLKNNQVRQVILTSEIDEIKNYIESNFSK